MSSVAELEAIVAAAKGDVSDEWIAELAMRLAASGNLVRNHAGATADIPSTGGPSSLTTLLCPLLLTTCGFLVPKLGVPGRPAGGIDVMSQVPGYRTLLDGPSVRAVLARCGYAHFEAANAIAPLDRDLFAHRQAVGAQGLAPLVIASLLAKKYAVGVDRVGLDVRAAGHGNFGGTCTEARSNVRRFLRVADLLGIRAVGFISDASQPYQPFVGRGEALLALQDCMANEMNAWLERHVGQCELMVARLSGAVCKCDPPQLRRAFEANLIAQGGDWDGFQRTVAALRLQPTTTIRAPCSGYVRYDLEIIRDILVAAQLQGDGPGRFDDSVGLVFLQEPDCLVVEGQPLMRVRCNVQSLAGDLAPLATAVRVSGLPVGALVEVVDA